MCCVQRDMKNTTKLYTFIIQLLGCYVVIIRVLFLQLDLGSSVRFVFLSEGRRSPQSEGEEHGSGGHVVTVLVSKQVHQISLL